MGALAVAAAVLLFFALRRAPVQGEAIAKDRTEVKVGDRAVLVLEPGARVAYRGDEVTQDGGDVFYRASGPMKVKTPAGEVTVKGTSFRVKVMKREIVSGVAGAAIGAALFVGVYEGKVAVSHAKGTADVAAGESVTVDGGGEGEVKKGELTQSAQAFDDEAMMAANRNLVDQVRLYKERLQTIETEKTKVEKRLADAEQKLATADGGSAARHPFDLTADDWAEMAKNGVVKARTPCIKGPEWTPPAEQLQKAGLSPQDGAVIKNAYKASNDRVWRAVKPLCVQVVGKEELADHLGTGACIHLVHEVSYSKDRKGTEDAMRLVAEIRAGQKPMPGPNEVIHPEARLMLALSGELKAFEDDVAQSFGPEEAHRIAFSDAFCMGSSTWSTGPIQPK
jgi:hypothetical protein